MTKGRGLPDWEGELVGAVDLIAHGLKNGVGGGGAADGASIVPTAEAERDRQPGPAGRRVGNRRAG